MANKPISRKEDLQNRIGKRYIADRIRQRQECQVADRYDVEEMRRENTRYAAELRFMYAATGDLKF